MNAQVQPEEPIFLRQPLPPTAESYARIIGIRDGFFEGFEKPTGDAAKDMAILASTRSQISDMWRPVLGSGERAFYQDGRSSLAQYHEANNIFAGHDIFSPIARIFGDAEAKLRVFAKTKTKVPAVFYEQLENELEILVGQCEGFMGMRSITDYFNEVKKYFDANPELHHLSRREIGVESNRLYDYHRTSAHATKQILQHVQSNVQEIGKSLALEGKAAG